MKVLILGHGYVGQALQANLPVLMDDCQVDLKSREELDYHTYNTLFRYIVQTHPQYVINTCGYTGRPNVDACEADKDNTWYYNVTLPVCLQQVCTVTRKKFIHVSSGCIYDGYEKEFEETDQPNFGLMNPSSSWYSKTKHACEMTLRASDMWTLRIRMPFCSTTSERNVLTKLLKYDNIINQTNSMTCIEDLSAFIAKILEKPIPPGIYNVTNPEAPTTKDIINVFKAHGLHNDNWNYISLEELKKYTKTGRSNCVLSTRKINDLGLSLPKTLTSLSKCIEKISDKLL
jgi:dTDP-4-dehydrorhamnose reductase